MDDFWGTSPEIVVSGDNVAVSYANQSDSFKADMAISDGIDLYFQRDHPDSWGYINISPAIGMVRVIPEPSNLLLSLSGLGGLAVLWATARKTGRRSA